MQRKPRECTLKNRASSSCTQSSTLQIGVFTSSLSGQRFKEYRLNRTCISVNGRSLKITLTVPLMDFFLLSKLKINVKTVRRLVFGRFRENKIFLKTNFRHIFELSRTSSKCNKSFLKFCLVFCYIAENVFLEEKNILGIF